MSTYPKCQECGSDLFDLQEVENEMCFNCQECKEVKASYNTRRKRMNIWNNIELLDKLERQRNIKRETGKRLSFDCFELKCRGDRVHCSLNKKIGQAKDGSLPLISVLKGITPEVCKSCQDYKGCKE